MESVVIAEEEKEALRQGYVSKGYFDVITEKEFLRELASEEKVLESTGGFVGLGRFVRTHLGNLGYDYRCSFDLAERLEAQGIVEMYKVDNPYDMDSPTTAIRSAKNKL